MPLTSEQLVFEDVSVRDQLNASYRTRKGAILGPEARGSFAAARSSTPLAHGVDLEEGAAGDVSGLWCRPWDSVPERTLVFLHGGGYMMGSASSTASFASQLALRCRADTFCIDYRLAPEHAFPAALDDTVSAYRDLAGRGGSVALVGESAGGGLALALLVKIASDPSVRSAVAAALFSPWLDLSQSGESYISRAVEDPIFTKPSLQALADIYLQGANPSDPRASPLWASPAGLPPVRIDVGEDEVLLDDTRRFVDRAEKNGVAVVGAIWEGMSHVFPVHVGRLKAADRAMDKAGAFLDEAFYLVDGNSAGVSRR